MEKLHLLPTFLQSNRRINMVEEVEEQSPQNNTLGSFTFRMVSQELCSKSSQQIHKWSFHCFLDTERDMRERTTDTEESRDKARVDRIFWEGHSDVGMRVPVATSSSQSHAHLNCCISWCSWLTHPRTHLGIFQHRGQVEIIH